MPPASTIEPLPDAFGEIAPGMSMEVIPGRPGINRIVVRTPEAMSAIDRMELGLEDLDEGSSTSVPLVLEGMAGAEPMLGTEHVVHVTPNAGRHDRLDRGRHRPASRQPLGRERPHPDR